jgi:hypothetical protein
MTDDLVHALAELGIRVRRETGADAGVGRLERRAAVLAQVVTAGRDADVHAIPVANDRVHAHAAGPRLPLTGVLVVADARDHLPGITTVVAPEQRRRLDAAEQLLLSGARFERPDVGERASVLFGERGSRFRFLEGLPEVGRAQDLHAEEWVAARSIEAR